MRCNHAASGACNGQVLWWHTGGTESKAFGAQRSVEQPIRASCIWRGQGKQPAGHISGQRFSVAPPPTQDLYKPPSSPRQARHMRHTCACDASTTGFGHRTVGEARTIIGHSKHGEWHRASRQPQQQQHRGNTSVSAVRTHDFAHQSEPYDHARRTTGSSVPPSATSAPKCTQA
ncbi:hypothetical protein A4X13_0g8673 [Tilletia indica]|uniref:Uncharacterized protein n=1 Tax=Tilletia indica TaxID=43049 RepID=A0A177T137_9BASI|nr:hypothetical protein A4X13_0g8673 [Tilletia indica]